MILKESSPSDITMVPYDQFNTVFSKFAWSEFCCIPKMSTPRKHRAAAIYCIIGYSVCESLMKSNSERNINFIPFTTWKSSCYFEIWDILFNLMSFQTISGHVYLICYRISDNGIFHILRQISFLPHSP